MTKAAKPLHPHPSPSFRGANVLIDWVPCLSHINHHSQDRKYNCFKPIRAHSWHWSGIISI